MTLDDDPILNAPPKRVIPTRLYVGDLRHELEHLIDDIKNTVEYDIDEDALKFSIEDGETTAFYFTVYLQRGQRKNYNHSIVVSVYGSTFDELATNGRAEFERWKKENGLGNQSEDKSE